jgi:hypothetical protein
VYLISYGEFSNTMKLGMPSYRMVVASILGALLVSAPAAFAQVSTAKSDLTLYDVKLKGATLSDFMKAAGNAGAMSLPTYKADGFPTASVEHVGVPGMKQFAVVEDDGKVLSVQFLLTQDDKKANVALRELLLRKYGLPVVAVNQSPIGRTFASSEDSPVGQFEWQFKDGMKLSYVQKPDGSAPMLFYTDVMALYQHAQRLVNRDIARREYEAGRHFDELSRGF